jgi:magnesium transporter
MFEGSLEKMVALAVLSPIVAQQGGNADTQTMTVAVRALATRELTDANAWRVILRELSVGGLNGWLSRSSRASRPGLVQVPASASSSGSP